MRFTKSKVKEIREAVSEALNNIGMEDVRFEVSGNIRYSHTEATMKILATPTTVDGEDFDKEREEFNRYAPALGLSPEDYGRTFDSRGKSFTICGIKPRVRKYPVLAKDSSGSIYKFPMSRINQVLSQSV